MIFVDEATVVVKAGDGGQGCESFYRDKYMRYPRPDGGDGGNGGDVVVTSDKSVHTLLDFKFRQHHAAHRGGNASSNKKHGKVGACCVLRVPIGTIVRDTVTGLQIKDLLVDQETVVVAKGAAGGRGNADGRTPTLPGKGEERTIGFELKVVADVGLVGFPNAGKSTIISNISKVKSKIANYPFTTKQPILGYVHGEDVNFVVADLPGIIEGAHEGRGLGDRFLRHAERTTILVHVLDMAGSEGRDPLLDYEQLNHELESYSENFLAKKRIVVANKMDMDGAEENLARFTAQYGDSIIPVSALQKSGLDELVSQIRSVLLRVAE